MHPSRLPIEELEKECRWSFSRASGPGGQHRNKVETAAMVVHLPSGISGAATEKRSQAENRAVAMHRLRCALAVEWRDLSAPKALENAMPSEVWMAYARGGRLKIAPTNPLYPSVLAEAMERLVAMDWNLGSVAEAMRISATQLIQLLGDYPAALQALNAQLVAQGRSPRTVKR
jgi:hypothetical protein